MISDTMLHGRVRLAATGLLVTALAGIGSCRDSVGLDDDDDPGPAGLIVSDPVTPSAPAGQAALLGPAVAYVSFPPGTIPNGVSATISNRRTGAALMLGLVAGGLDPVAIAAGAGDTLDFAIDTGGTQRVRFARPVPEFLLPTVVRTEPPAGKRDVPLNLRVRIIFSEPVNPASVSAATLGLLQAGTSVSGEVSLSADGLEASFQPAADLVPATQYTITVSGEIRDFDGGQLQSSVTATFTTGTASGRAVALRFDRQPVNTFTGVVMPNGVVVSATDIFGNPATGFTGSVTLAIGLNPAGGSLSGTTTRAAGPVAEFDDLRIDRGGTGYTLIATSNGLTSATSSRFDIVDVVPATDLIAFYSYGQGLVFTKDHGGGLAGLLVPEGAETYTDREAAWSPDGRKVAFTRYVGGFGPGYGEIFLVNANGSGVTGLGQEGHSPAWSPGGTRIAFASGRDGNSEIYVMNGQGSDFTGFGAEVVRLTDDPAFDDQPAWSPDGTKLVFVRSSGSYFGSEIYLMNADGSGVTGLGQEGRDPAWSPDGTRIAFTRRVVRNGSRFDVYVMNPDGSGVTDLTGTQPRLHSYDPAWSPDGGRIAFSSSVDPDWEPDQIYAMNADGSGVTRLTGTVCCTLRASLGPAWSPVSAPSSALTEGHRHDR